MNQSLAKLLFKITVVLIFVTIGFIVWIPTDRAEVPVAAPSHVRATPFSKPLVAMETPEPLVVERDYKNALPDGLSLVGHWHLQGGFGPDSPNNGASVDLYFSDSEMTEVSKLPNDGDIHVSSDHYRLSVIDRQKRLVKLDGNDYLEMVKIPDDGPKEVTFTDLSQGTVPGAKARRLTYVDPKTAPE